MKEYILKIVGVSLLAAFSEHLADKKWKKYINLISGFMIISVLLSPFTFNRDIKIFAEFKLDSDYSEEGNEILYENVKRELEKKIASDLKRRVLEEFSENVTADVTVLCDKDGKIERVKSITLKGRKNQKITDRIKFIYGADEVTWV